MLQLGARMRFVLIAIIVFGCSKQQAVEVPHFSGVKAFEYLEKQCEFGHRYPGSKEHINLKNYFVDFLDDKVDSLSVYDHKIIHPYDKKEITLYNIFAQFNLNSKDRILLLAHWDTREIADMDSFNGFFIRAPKISQLGKRIKILATYNNQPVMITDGMHYATTFHPEIGGDCRIYKYIIDKINE